MSSSDNIHDELRGLNSNLPSPDNQSPLAVPEGYFDGLAGSVLAKIRAVEALPAGEEIKELSPFLAEISRTMPLAIPAQYFQETVKDLPVLIREDLSAEVLKRAGRSMPYEVPTGYFDQLPGQILSRLKPAGRVISMGIKWKRYAAAAVTAGILVLSGYFYFSQKNSAAVATVTPVAQQLKNVSTKELDEFIKTTEVTASSTETAQTSLPAPEVKSMLHDVTDKELDAFLAQVPSDEEDVLVIN